MEPSLPPLNACWEHYCWEFDVTVPAQAIALIKQFEGLRLTPYKDGVGYGTIGYGHKIKPTETFTEITPAQADDLCEQDAQEAMDAVLNAVTVPLNDNQLSVLIDFTFNEGEGHLDNSGLLEVLNEGAYSQVPQHLLQWNKAGGEIEMGLTRRRQAEVEIWNTP